MSARARRLGWRRALPLLCVLALGAQLGPLTSAQTPPPQYADLTLDKADRVDPVAIGGTIIYDLRFRNNGPDAANGMQIVDQLPAEVEFLDAQASHNGVCTADGLTVTCAGFNPIPDNGQGIVHINVKANAEGTVSNTAQISTDSIDFDSSNNGGAESTRIVSGPRGDLEATKFGPAEATVGDTFVYNLSVRNHGPDAAEGVELSDVLPSGVEFVRAGRLGCTHSAGTVTCNAGTLDDDHFFNADIEVRATTVGTVSNTASASSDTADPNSSNNESAAVSTQINQAPTPTPTEEPTPTPTEEPTPTPTEEPTPTPTEEPTPTPTEEPTPTPTEEPTPTPAVETTTSPPTTTTAASPPPEPIDGCPTSSRQAAGFPSDGLLAFVPAAIQLEQQRRRRLSLVEDKPSAQKGGKRSRSKVIKIVAVIAVLAVAAVVGVLLLTGGDKGKNYATLGGLEGRVDLQKPEKAFEPAAKAATLDIGDKVRTGADGLARIDYTDGSLTRLDHNTTFQVQELINDSTHKSIKTNLEVGRIWNRVNKLTKQEDRFEVKTVTAVATVHGTTFVNDCRFLGGRQCTHLGISGTYDVLTDAGILDSITAGECKTEEGEEIGPCRFTEKELETDPFLNKAAQLDGLELGDVIVLPEIFGGKAAALVPVEEETQVQAAQASPATTTTPTEEPACTTGEPASRGTSLPLAGAIALMVIFFGIAWARPNRKSDPAGDSAN